MASLRGLQQPDLSKKLYKLIKTENHAVSAYEAAGRERASIATQLSEWGEATGDDALSELSDKLGVILSEIAEQEDQFAQNLEESRSVLKVIRNTESSVQPSRDHKAKIQDEIQKLKYKDPDSPKIVQLEQELVRAEAQSLVAEAQLTNITRQKFKEAYDIHLAATIERAEKQILLARHGRQILNLLDDTPVVPGDAHPTFEQTEAARQILNDAEEELRAWQPSHETVHSNAGSLGTNAMPGAHSGGATSTGYDSPTSSTVQAAVAAQTQETTRREYTETAQPQQTMHQGYTETAQPQQTTYQGYTETAQAQQSTHKGFVESGPLLAAPRPGYGETGQPQQTMQHGYGDSISSTERVGAGESTLGEGTYTTSTSEQGRYFVDGELRHPAGAAQTSYTS